MKTRIATSTRRNASSDAISSVPTIPLPSLPEPLPLVQATLPNGARVIACDLPHLHRVSLSIGFGVGSRDERAEVHGIAHLLEHMMFRGTETHPSLRAVNEAFEEVGANLNAFTARESTTYETALPPESLGAGIELLADVILNPKLTGIAAEREIILEEILADYSEKDELINADDLLLEELFPHSGLGRAIAGDPAAVRKLTRAAVAHHYAEAYRGPAAVIAMVGPIGDPQAAIARVSEAFAALPAGGNIPRDTSTGAPSSGAAIRYRRNEGTGQTEVAFGVSTFPASHPLFPAVELGIRLLDDGLSSRLPRRLIDELGLVYDVEAFASAYREHTICEVRATTRHRRVTRVVDELLAVLETLASEPPPADELARVQKRVLWEHQALLDNPPSLAIWLSAAARRGQVADPRARCERLLAVSPEGVREAVETAFFGGGQRLVLVGEQGRRGLENVRQRMAKRCAQTVELHID